MQEERACRLCFPGATDYGELVPGYYLVEEDNIWFLVDGNGHNKQAAFRGRPRVDPDGEKSDDEINNQSAQETKIGDDWFDDAQAIKIFGGYQNEHLVGSTMNLGIACHKAGWEPEDGSICAWLYERAARLIEKKEVND
jgi:hypothetical protein